MLLKKMIHPDLKTLDGKVFERIAARAIILKDHQILLLYTKRYDDYSFPGGGVDQQEDIIQGLTRELEEEIGAVSYKIKSKLGELEEYRPYFDENYDYMHMVSHYFICELTGPLNMPKFEDYEIKNGMESKWINLDEAIEHNEKLMADKPRHMGFSVERETYILKKIKSMQEETHET